MGMVRGTPVRFAMTGSGKQLETAQCCCHGSSSSAGAILIAVTTCHHRRDANPLPELLPAVLLSRQGQGELKSTNRPPGHADDQQMFGMLYRAGWR